MIYVCKMIISVLAILVGRIYCSFYLQYEAILSSECFWDLCPTHIFLCHLVLINHLTRPFIAELHAEGGAPYLIKYGKPIHPIKFGWPYIHLYANYFSTYVQSKAKPAKAGEYSFLLTFACAVVTVNTGVKAALADNPHPEFRSSILEKKI